jgi:hypothetical protein
MLFLQSFKSKCTITIPHFIIPMDKKVNFMRITEKAIKQKICPLEFAVNAISGKWKIPIVWRINEGEKTPK